MSTELEPRPVSVLAHPTTGEVIDLGSSTDSLGLALAQLRQLEDQVKVAKRAISDEVIRRMDIDALWTHHGDGVKLTSRSPEQTAYDIERLVETLARLAGEKKITEDAAKRCINLKPEAKKAGINALLKSGGEVKEAILACEVPVDRPRSVKVEVR